MIQPERNQMQKRNLDKKKKLMFGNIWADKAQNCMKSNSYKEFKQ